MIWFDFTQHHTMSLFVSRIIYVIYGALRRLLHKSQHEASAPLQAWTCRQIPARQLSHICALSSHDGVSVLCERLYSPILPQMVCFSSAGRWGQNSPIRYTREPGAIWLLHQPAKDELKHSPFCRLLSRMKAPLCTGQIPQADLPYPGECRFRPQEGVHLTLFGHSLQYPSLTPFQHF